MNPPQTEKFVISGPVKAKEPTEFKKDIAVIKAVLAEAGLSADEIDALCRSGAAVDGR